MSNYTSCKLPEPVGYWVLYPHSTMHTQFSMHRKPMRLQIWFTEILLGWKWRDAQFHQRLKEELKERNETSCP